MAVLRNAPFFLWIILAVYILMASSFRLGFSFVVLFFAYYLVNAKLFCTRCCNFGKLCSFGFSGKVASSLFRQNAKEMDKRDYLIVYGLFTVAITFPLYYLSILNSASMIGYSVLTLVFITAHYLTDCRKCENTRCHMNPKCQKRL